MINVSVIVPTYNYAHYIETAIHSVLKQDYDQGSVEIIVVDDGSTDNTAEILKPYIDAGLINYYYQDNKGKASATRVAIEKSTGKYIFNLDADDYFLPGKISNYVNAFELDESIVHVGSAAEVFNQTLQTSFNEPIEADLLGKPINGFWLLYHFYNNFILWGGGSTYAARASVLKKIPIPDEVDMFIDEFLILVLLPFGKSYFTEKPQSVWRVHTSNYSGRLASKEILLKKEERLLRSSNGVLKYMKETGFDRNLIRIYTLLDATRRITLKENRNEKSISDIFTYIREVRSLNPEWNLIKNYNVLNRLIPCSILAFLKGGRRVMKTAIQPSKVEKKTPDLNQSSEQVQIKSVSSVAEVG
ncbi:glycosyltransferase family 2 protein [Desertivirga arenae]|uniref:glycosyltransferase family 2 protein n=1 Tax=Desertivirga arenae TaxID=2810309 RepID=UPI001A95A81F|nr:glycosyltransferase family A protein [Pedobacter sp. SYSU D00823]